MIDEEDLKEMETAFEDGEWNGMWTSDLLAEVRELKARLNDAQDLLENCGYCRECFWDRESISDVAVQVTEPVWPDVCTALCDSCMVDFKEMVSE